MIPHPGHSITPPAGTAPASPAGLKTLTDFAGALLVAGILLAVLVAYTGDLFPQIEYRQWIRAEPSSLRSLLAEAFAPVGHFSRAFSYWFVVQTWKVCGGRVAWANTAQLALIAFSAGGLFWFLRRVNPSRDGILPAVAISCCFAFSLPVIDAASWQATVLDKLAMAFCVAGLHIFMTVGRLQSPRARFWTGNFLSLLIVVPAYNAKEAAWVLVPIGFLLVVAPPGSAPGTWLKSGAWRDAALHTALPFAYAIYHVGMRLRYLAVVNGTDMNHIIGGDIIHNLRNFFLSFFNLGAGTGSALTGAFFVILFLFLALAVIAAWKHASSALVLPVLGTMAALAIPASTRYGSLFYLLVPSLFFWWLVHTSLVEASTLLRGRWRPAVLGAGAVGLAIFRRSIWCRPAPA